MMPEKLARMQQDADSIFKDALKAVVPEEALKRFCQLDGEQLVVNGAAYDLNAFERIFVLGAGKGAASMAKAIEEILGDLITEGVICVKYGHVESLETIRIIEAGHPVPDENGYRGAKAILELAAKADEQTLVICLLTGGGSALIPCPSVPLTLAEKQETTRILLACGADIHEINTIRKHLSSIKGGHLAKTVFPGTLISLILSDVVGDDLDSIASGPCVPDPKTFADCIEILERYAIVEQIPHAVVNYLKEGVEGVQHETPKVGDESFGKSQNVIIGRNFDALLQAEEAAIKRGYNTLVLSSMIEGETRDVAGFHCAIAKETALHEKPLEKPACILSGGETTVTIRGAGKGGRNQEFSLAAAQDLAGVESVVCLSAGTDGTDGPTDAAGAYADNSTLERAANLGLDVKQYLNNNDSYHLFEQLGDLYKTGPTNTNVMDIRIFLVR